MRRSCLLLFFIVKRRGISLAPVVLLGVLVVIFGRWSFGGGGVSDVVFVLLDRKLILWCGGLNGYIGVERYCS